MGKLGNVYFSVIVILLMVLMAETTMHKLPVALQARYASAKLAIHYAASGEY